MDAATGRAGGTPDVSLPAADRAPALAARQRRLRLGATAAVLLWSLSATGGLVLSIAREAEREEEVRLIEETWTDRVQRLETDLAAARQAASEASEARLAAIAALAERDAALLRAEQVAEAERLALTGLRSELAAAVRARREAERRAEMARHALSVTTTDLARKEGAETNLSDALGTLSLALITAVKQREAAETNAAALEERVAALEGQLSVSQYRMGRALEQVSDAVVMSLGGLDKLFAPTGLDTDALVNQLRATWSGEGGPLIPAALTLPPLSGTDPEAERIASMLGELERVQLLKAAAAKLPFALPVKAAFRFTSGFGDRGRRNHEGVDLAGDMGTPIHATADGVVTFAGRMRGFGNLIRIRHEFGIETLYAHLSAIRVKVGERVAVGDRIGDMGNTGRSTGTHLHYEIHVNGTPVNPMSYIKAARDVF